MKKKWLLMEDKIKIFCTLGPSSLNEWVIKRLDDIGVDLFRVNLSHTEITKLEGIIKLIQSHTSRPICLDTQGAQIRTGDIENGSVFLNDNDIIEIAGEKIVGSAKRISVTPDYVITQIQPGDLISVDFDSVILQVLRRQGDSLIAKVISEGVIGSNKAVTVDRDIELDGVTHKDIEAVHIGMEYGIKHFALSFASSRQVVEEFRSYTGKDSFIISKIESKKGISHLDEICQSSDAILIDRGDLSREEPIDKIPFIQKLIIKRARTHNTPVYVATNLLESMVKSRMPTRAEANDVINTLLDGVQGLVLAAETAIGAYPVNCARIISRMVKRFKGLSNEISLEDLHQKGSFLLGDPHGGFLVNRVREDVDLKEADRLKKLTVDLKDLLNLEQIALGTFSPLEGFMTQREVDSSVKHCSLVSGVVWTLPITLQIAKEDIKDLNVGDTVALVMEGCSDIYGLLHIEDIFMCDLDIMAKEIFGTTDENHAGVMELMKKGPCFLGGKIDLLKRVPSAYKHYELTPRQTRMIFENKGWSRVVGFHTRNVIHRVHEHIQMLAFEQYHCDGLFVHPVVGPKKKGDYHADIILKSYELMTEKYYPKGKVILGAFQNYSRYCGPREAVFTALCRKNFGCSHFIVGRDHTGVGNYYGVEAVPKLFQELGDIGIVPILFDEIHFCKKCEKYVSQCRHDGEDILYISGTQGRQMFLEDKNLPDWFMRKDISDFILQEMSSGKEVFFQ